MNFEKIFEMLNELQKSALICLIIQLPLCYTFMYIYSDFFAQQDFINRTIFALSLDMSILFISIFGLLIVSIILGRYDTSSVMYLFTGGVIYSFSIYILEKIVDNNGISKIVINYIFFMSGIFITSIVIRIIEHNKKKKV